MKETLGGKVVVSFVIPAFNEEGFIREAIQSIKLYSPNYKYQIVVVDNGSTDKTSDKAEAENVILIKQARTTIASARNRGARMFEGEVLVFLDADVAVTSTWQKEIDKTVEQILKEPLIVTGSRCGVKNEKNWIARFWFLRMVNNKFNYINSGHLITSRKLFDHVGGFSEELHTAEDYDFCVKAKQAGAEIINNQKLYVIHYGYPETIKDFIVRERWHGSEDFKNLHNIMKSKTALIAIINIILMISFIVIAVSKGSIFYFLPYLGAIYILSGSSTLIKFGFGNLIIFSITSLIYTFYYLGRSLAFIDRITKPLALK
jgi:glycosyltransferase involved in cell wall biosynthesis